MSWTIRDERPGDFVAIAALTQAAFRDAEHSDGSEPAIVERLRARGALINVEDALAATTPAAAFAPAFRDAPAARSAIAA